MKHICFVALAAMMYIMSSCTVVQTVTDRFDALKGGRGKSQQPVVAEKVKPPKKKDVPAAKLPDAATSGSVPQAGVRPTDSELGGGQWHIVAAGDCRIEEDEDFPYISFDPAAGRFYASDGCNIINGNYLMRSDGVMAFSDVLSTMKYCPDAEFAPLVGAALSDNAAYTTDCRRSGHDTYLSLRDSKGREQLLLRRHNMEFLNGNWRVVSINGKDIDGEDCTVFFDVAELKVHGNTGCNFFNGRIYIDPVRANAIDFSNMGTTRMACPDAARESAMLVALESAYSAKGSRSGDTAVLLDSDGKELMELRRIPLTIAE